MQRRQTLRLAPGRAWLTAALLPLAACVSDSPLPDGPAIPVVASLAATPSSGAVPLSVAFSAGASGGGVAPLRFDYDFNSDGVIDSANTGPVLQRVFEAPGSFSVRLTVTDAVGTSAQDTVNILVLASANEAPAASLIAAAASGTAPFTVAFDARASSDSDGSIVRYDYDFDSDGIWDAYDSGSQVEWTYSMPGSFTARLRVTDNSGAQASVELGMFVNAAPVALLSAVPLIATAGSIVTFSAAGSNDADGAITSHEWDADGNGSFEQNTGATGQLQVIFPNAGTFTVRLRVTDNFGAQTQTSVQVQIS